ncbi:MAG: hypothetical protein ACMUIE_06210, partial [Thermoplasmatota archaeon]
APEKSSIDKMTMPRNGAVRIRTIAITQSTAFPLISSFIRALYNFDLEDIKGIGDWADGSFDGLLVKGELMIQRGEFFESMNLFNTILSMKNVPQEVNFIANIGKIKSLHGLNKIEDMRELINYLKKTIDNKLAIAYIKEIEADILSMRGNYKEAEVLFKSSIKTFHHYNYQILLCISYGNYGILLFNMARYDDAEKAWIQAKKFAIESNNSLLAANVNPNLASIMRIKKDFNKSEKLLKEAENIFKELNNLEKLSNVEFNRSLLLLSMGQLIESFHLFEKSLNDTYPLIPESMKGERINIYKRELENIKYTLNQNGQKIELVYNGDS